MNVLPRSHAHKARYGESRKVRRKKQLYFEALEKRIVLDSTSAGPNGIDAIGLTTDAGTSLDGRTFGGKPVFIGQVEGGRPGLFGANKDNEDNSHPDVVPKAVFYQDKNAVWNKDVSTQQGHATAVAGVMIANGASANKGVAPQAGLYASAERQADGNSLQIMAQYILSMQRVAESGTTANGVRATNMSFSWGGPGTPADGQSALTRAVDWSSNVHHVLYVFARGNTNWREMTPKDHYNGINVGATKKVGGVFSQISKFNDFTNNVGPPRRLSHIVAPGQGISVPRIGANGGGYTPENGTSVAAPHATGTVALLEQYRLSKGWRWFTGLPEVMKVVLMNSADKLKDNGDGKRLGMSKTIVKRDGTSTWLQSDARDEPQARGGAFISLDNEFGTGQLNARRALTQYKAGKQNAGAPVPIIGWDVDGTGTDGDIKKYPLNQALMGDSYVSITLTWNRQIELINRAGESYQFDVIPGEGNDDFTKPALNKFPNLNLYLMPKGATRKEQFVWRSVSDSDNVEHIFFNLPDRDAEYEIWVEQASGGPGGVTYALAWWGAAGQAPSSGSGEVSGRVWNDLNEDGIDDGDPEDGIAFVDVDLYGSGGTWVATTKTDLNGDYKFTGLPPG